MLLAAETNENFVDIDVPPWAWVVLAVSIGVLILIDLYRHRDDHEPTGREALTESVAWVAASVAFGLFVLLVFGGEAFGEYTSGYLIEKSLSIDNVFVWSMLFSSMAIPLRYQHRVLFWGIFGALVLRAVFIVAGVSIITRFAWVLAIFGVFLVYTGLKIIRHRDDEGETTSTAGLGLLKRIMPVTDTYDGHNFLTVANGKRAATPLLAALVVVEFTDIIFAVDSVPAILGVSNESYIVFASNAFAIMGLRAMYFLLADAKERFHYLSHALGTVLVFVGLKMIASQWIHLNTWLSLAIIVGILIVAVIFSEQKNKRLAASKRN